MAAGQRKYDLIEIRFAREVGGGFTCNAQFSWGIEEADGVLRDRRGNTATLSKADLAATLTASERQMLQDVFAKIKTAVKAKAGELALAIEE